MLQRQLIALDEHRLFTTTPAYLKYLGLRDLADLPPLPELETEARVSLTFLSLTETLGPSLPFWVYGLLTVVAEIFADKLVPEAKGRTLEEIENFWHAQAQASAARPMTSPARTRAS